MVNSEPPPAAMRVIRDCVRLSVFAWRCLLWNLISNTCKHIKHAYSLLCEYAKISPTSRLPKFVVRTFRAELVNHSPMTQLTRREDLHQIHGRIPLRWMGQQPNRTGLPMPDQFGRQSDELFIASVNTLVPASLRQVSGVCRRFHERCQVHIKEAA